MKIKSVSIKNYRGIRLLENIQLTSLTAIIGKNDAGKSAILHAINSFYNENKLIDEDRYLGAGDDETVIEIVFDGEELSSIPKMLLDREGNLRIRKSCVTVGENYKSIIIQMDYVNENYKNIIQMTAAKQTSLFRQFEIEVVAPYTVEKVFELINKINESEEELEETEYEIKSSLLKNILKELYPQYSLFLADTNLDTGSTSFQNQFKKIVSTAIETHLDDFDNLQTEVSTTLNSEVEKISRYMEKHYPGLELLKPEISYDWSKLINFDILMKDSSQFEINLAHKGTGVQRLFMVSYFQYLAEEAINDTCSYIFAIEEPETFLHPGAQRTLLESIKQIAERHQVIITTHSPVFASEINNENIIVVNKQGNQSVYKQKEEISPELIVEELGIRASDNILSSRLLVFVEGSNDVKFWEIIYRKLLGRGFQNDGILFMPGGGNELHNIAEMNLMNKLNRNFVVIVDKDAGAVDYESKLAKQLRLKQLVESKGGNLLVLRKREIENYYSPSTVKELLSEVGYEVANLEFSDYEDVQAKLKAMFFGRNVQFKIKNNLNVFERMTEADLDAISRYYEDGQEYYEFREILGVLIERLEA
ncbi:MAG TPA: AAA family ATPase [Sedimentibacter sp.]|nr:AAA family ATPase [Sedimentibacter sp.]